MLGEITLVKEYDDWLDYIHEFLNASQISWKTILIVSASMCRNSIEIIVVN